MKYLPALAGVLLGLLFLAASVPMLLHVPMPEPHLTPGSADEHYMMALGPTGYMTLVKVCELLGALLVLVPRTRSLGLLFLGPVIVNILAYLILVKHGDGVPAASIIMTSAAVVLALYLLYVERHRFAGLLHRPAELAV